MLNTQAAKDAIYAGRAIKSHDASPSAQAWLRREAAAGRIARIAGQRGWCPAHSGWTFYVSSNHAPAFIESCEAAFDRIMLCAAMDAHVRANPTTSPFRSTIGR